MECALPREDHVGDRQFVMALARGLDILRAFHPEELALGNQELARRTKLPKPTISRLTYTLTQLGYLNYDRRRAVYSLGPGALGLGYVALTNLNVRRIARPWMQELAMECGASVGLAARNRMEMICIEHREGRKGHNGAALRSTTGLGMCLATSAPGRTYLAGLPESRRAQELESLICAYPDKGQDIRDGVERAVQDIQTKGFCVIADDALPYGYAIGAPIVAPGESGVYALNCRVSASHTQMQDLHNVIGPKLAEIARKTAAELNSQQGGSVSKNLSKTR